MASLYDAVLMRQVHVRSGTKFTGVLLDVIVALGVIVWVDVIAWVNVIVWVDVRLSVGLTG